MTNAKHIDAVIFDWGGTLTPWHTIDLLDQWLAYAEVYAPENSRELAESLLHEEQKRWGTQFETQGGTGTGTLEHLFSKCGVDTSSASHGAALQAYLNAWDPHTYTDDDAVDMLEGLRARGIKTAVLSNTMWPRSHHEWILQRDGVHHLFDYMLFTSDVGTGKPHRSVFTHVLYELDVEPEHAAFVGDRPFDDIQGAQSVGMRGILIPHTSLPANQSSDLGVVPDAIAQRLGDVLDIVLQWNSAN